MIRLLTDATVVAAVLTLAAAALAYLWQRRRDREVMRHALVAELRHVRQHYSYAASELVPGTSSSLMQKRLHWSRFGELAAVRELGRYAALGPTEMQLLLQLGFRIRNTDQLLDMLLKNDSSIGDDDLEEARRRMGYVSNSASTLLQYLERQDPALARLTDPG